MIGRLFIARDSNPRAGRLVQSDYPRHRSRGKVSGRKIRLRSLRSIAAGDRALSRAYGVSNCWLVFVRSCRRFTRIPVCTSVVFTLLAGANGLAEGVPATLPAEFRIVGNEREVAVDPQTRRPITYLTSSQFTSTVFYPTCRTWTADSRHVLLESLRGRDRTGHRTWPSDNCSMADALDGRTTLAGNARGGGHGSLRKRGAPRPRRSITPITHRAAIRSSTST